MNQGRHVTAYDDEPTEPGVALQRCNCGLTASGLEVEMAEHLGGAPRWVVPMRRSPLDPDHHDLLRIEIVRERT